jgi:hypothetical protein
VSNNSDGNDGNKINLTLVASRGYMAAMELISVEFLSSDRGRHHLRARDADIILYTVATRYAGTQYSGSLAVPDFS